jgi:aspartate/methionine/tyrosine aminotransferase
VLGREDLQAIAEATEPRRIPVLSDEIYSRIRYDGGHGSLLGLPGMRERTVLLDGCSKTFAMTGWRLGWGVMPRPLAERVTRLMTNSNSCTATFVQRAGLAALRGPQRPVAEMVAELRRRRDRIVTGVRERLGLSCVLPEGAFYVFPGLRGIGSSASEVADRLLRDAGVACLAGTSFGRAGEGFLRFSYAASLESIGTAIERAAPVLEELRIGAAAAPRRPGT